MYISNSVINFTKKQRNKNKQLGCLCNVSVMDNIIDDNIYTTTACTKPSKAIIQPQMCNIYVNVFIFVSTWWAYYKKTYKHTITILSSYTLYDTHTYDSHIT